MTSTIVFLLQRDFAKCELASFLRKLNQKSHSKYAPDDTPKDFRETVGIAILLVRALTPLEGMHPHGQPWKANVS